MKIGVLTTSYPRWEGDYAGCFVADRVRALLEAGHAVDVLAAGEQGQPPGSTPSNAGADPLSDNLHVVRLPANVPGGPSLFYGAGAPEALESADRRAYLAALRYLAALSSAAATRARTSRWDAIEAHWLVPSALAALAGAAHLPVRAYAHSGDVALLERFPFGDALARYLAASGADLRFVTAELRDRFARLAGRAVGTVEPLEAPLALFRARGTGPDPALRAALGLGAPTLLAVGRLVPIKGHAALLRSCALLRRSRAAAGRPEVVILGDGPERQRLRDLAAALEVPLRLPGFVPRDEVARWLRAADLFVQPSIRLPSGRSEGAPVAVAEARAVGTPVVIGGDLATLDRALQSVTAA